VDMGFYFMGVLWQLEVLFKGIIFITKVKI
jgi:hypothetical protein